MDTNEKMQKGIDKINTGDLKGGLELINQSIASDPMNSDKLCARGQVYSALKMSHDAIRDYQMAIKYNPAVYQYHYNLGNVYFDNRQFREACEAYSKSIHINRDDSDVFANRGSCFIQISKNKLAYSDFKTALFINPNDYPAKIGLHTLLITNPQLKDLKAMEKHDFDALGYAIHHDLAAILFGMVKSKRYNEKEVQDMHSFVAVDKMNTCLDLGFTITQFEIDFILKSTFDFVRNLPNGFVDNDFKSSVTNYFYRLMQFSEEDISSHYQSVLLDVENFIR